MLCLVVGFDRAGVLTRKTCVLSSQPGETWIKLYAVICVPVVADSAAAAKAAVDLVAQEVTDAVDDGLIISNPHHMRELYFANYALGYSVTPLPLCGWLSLLPQTHTFGSFAVFGTLAGLVNAPHRRAHIHRHRSRTPCRRPHRAHAAHQVPHAPGRPTRRVAA